MSDQPAPASLEQILKDLDAHIVESASTHRAAMSEIRDELQRHREEEFELRREVFGNGGVGLAERVRKLEEIAVILRRVAWIVVVAAITGSVGVIANLLWSIAVWKAEQQLP